MSNANKTREATLKLVETVYTGAGKEVKISEWNVIISTKYVKNDIKVRITIKNPNYNDNRHVWVVRNYVSFVGMDDVAEVCADFIFYNIISYVQSNYHLQHNSFELSYQSWDNTKTCTWFVEPVMDDKGDIRHFATMKEVTNIGGQDYEE